MVYGDLRFGGSGAKVKACRGGGEWGIGKMGKSPRT